ncbi:MAG: GLPGLI family protein [Maribacter sp.]|jgi:GLPGLI family protein
MKQCIILLAFLFPLLLSAQKGTVHYEETFSFKINTDDIQIEGIDAEQVISMMPSEQKNKAVLHFTEKESIYISANEEKATNKDGDMPELGIVIKMEIPKTHIYYDMDKKETSTLQNFFDRDFIITSKSEKKDWKVSNEQKVILDQLCLKATTMSADSNEITIWFVPQVQVDAAPGGIQDVPGLVLAAEMDGGRLQIKATKIDLGETEEDKIEAPTKGKKVTREKFQKIQKQKTDEMREQMQGGDGEGMFIIISD